MAGQCKATSKSTGKRCKNSARPRSTRCVKHARSSKPSVSTMPERARVEKYASMNLADFTKAIQRVDRGPVQPAHAAVKNMAKSWLKKDDELIILKGQKYQLGIQKDQCLKRERQCLENKRAQTNNNWLRGIRSRVLAPQSPTRKRPRSSSASRGS